MDVPTYLMSTVTEDDAEGVRRSIGVQGYPSSKDVDWTSDVYVKPLPGDDGH